MKSSRLFDTQEWARSLKRASMLMWEVSQLRVKLTVAVHTDIHSRVAMCVRVLVTITATLPGCAPA